MPREHYQFGPFCLDVAERELCRNGEPVALTAKTFDLLLLLVQGAGRTFQKSELLEALWPGSVVEESNLSQTIFLLRRALGENGEGSDYILTVPRRGYKFIATVSRHPIEENGSAHSPVAAGGRQWLWLSIAAVAILAAAWLAVLWVRQPRPLDLSAYRYRPFAFTQEFERSGSWSPDGKTVAFLQSSDDRPDSSGSRLMLQPSDGGAATQVADHAGYWRPVWSHDGSRVYFWKPDTLLQGVVGISGGIYSVSRGGGLPELVLKQNNVVYSFDLSPDGKSLALWRGLRASDGALSSSVWISSPPGAEPHEYTPAPFAVPANLYGFVRFSPDGKWLLASMSTFKGDQVETWLLPLPAGSPRQIFRNVAWNNITGASWMPDSRHLVFSASVAPLITTALWLADVREESLVKLTDGSVQQVEPAVSPDGSRLLFTRVDEDTDIMELPVDGSAPRKLLATSASELSPDWSPKGDEFAYVTERNGNDEIWLRSWPGDYERPVVTSRDFHAMVLGLGIPAISPDGTRIAYGVLQRDPKHVGAMYVSPRSGGAPTWIAEGGGGQTWSPDSQSLVFMWHTPRNAVVLATVRVGSSEPPFEIPNVACNPLSYSVWSPSGEWIACQTPTGSVLVSPDGKNKRSLSQLNAASVAWSKDSRTLYGLRNNDGRGSLVAADVNTGAVRTVAEYGSEIVPYARWSPFNFRPSLSADGKSLAVGTVKRQTDLWILEGFPK